MKLEVMKELTKAMQNRAKQPFCSIEENQDEIFGKMIASELKTVSRSVKFQVNH